MARTPEETLRQTLARVAPGTALRDGLERILRGRTGALIVLGQDRLVESLCTGGFDIGIEFSPTRLRELAKMDGAIVVDKDVSVIHKAGVQLVPDAAIPTSESGTRHRTAERVAVQTGHPVITVSASMQIIAIYVGGIRHQLEGSESILARAMQALATLERYRSRLDEVTAALSTQEIEDTTTLRDVALVLQRLEMVRRISEEISQYVLELGTDGRLIALQLEELSASAGPGAEVVLRDYSAAAHEAGLAQAPIAVEAAAAGLPLLSGTDIVDLASVGALLGFPATQESLERHVQPRGYRLLTRLSALPRAVAERVVDQFGGLQQLMAASIEDLRAVEGIGDLRAKSVREGLGRFAEDSLLERYR
jgi:diadenylate cyclase